jgi:uncharacterized membrane protein YcaP (DUF421 family)
MDAIADWSRRLLGLGLEGDDLGALQMTLRAAIVYVVTVAFVRMAKKRFMSGATAFDVILGIMLGSIVSRAVTGNAPFGPALAAAAALLAMHWLFSWIAVRFHPFGALIKGRSQTLVRDGRIDRDALRAAHMTDRDLWEDLRGKSVTDLDMVEEARLERGGQVSVAKRQAGAPKVVEVRVTDGVQTVRIEIGG